MAYLAPIHRASSVRHALKLRFLEPDNECLVVAKANRLEFYIHSEDGLSLQHSKAIYGRVTMLHRLQPSNSPTEHLFVGTDRYMYFTLSWDGATKQLRTERSYIDLADKSARESQTGERCLIDPSGKFMTLELFEGIITTSPIAQSRKKKGDEEAGMITEFVASRIPELFVRSSAFVHNRDAERERPRMALLYEEGINQRVRLRLRELEHSPGLGDAGDVEFNDLKGKQFDTEVELGASHVIPIAPPTYGALVLGETSILYFDFDSGRKLTNPLEEATIFVAWTQIDAQRFVLADDYGKLYVLMLVLNRQDEVTGWRVDVIGTTSRANVLVYLEGGRIFIGSHQGDSQLIQIAEKSTTVLQTFSNIAPILDLTIMDMGNRSSEGQSNEYSSGQARLVTGSGAFNDGSLRSVRSGVGLEDLGVLGEMEHVTDIFSLSSSPSSNQVDTLLVSFIDETRVFRFSTDGDVEEVAEFKGMSLGEGTLYAANLPNGRILQVTATTVRLMDTDSGMQVSEWSAPTNESITAVSASNDRVVAAVGGTTLVALDISGDIQSKSQKDFGRDRQIACITVPTALDQICVVGFWQGSEVSILRLDSLEAIHTEAVTEEGVSVPRSLLVVNVLEGQDPTMLIAMADGHVVTYSVNPQNYSLSSKESIILGTQQPGFRALPRGNGFYSVFATCEHPSLIYGSEGRLVFSAVTAEKASCVCPFDSEAYPGAIAIATSEDLRIAMVDTERTTHVQTLPVHETVRRIAYSPSLKAFGLGTINRKLVDGAEIVQSHFKLADEILFKELDTYALNEDELVESVIRAELDDGHGGLAERFIVGTAYLDDPQSDSVRGRIIVFEVTGDRLLKIVTEESVKGACRCLAMLNGMIVAALIKTVVVYKFEHGTSAVPKLNKQAAFRTSTAPIDIAVHGDFVAVADLMKSVSLVQYRKGTRGETDSLKEIARHFQTIWGTAVAQVGDNTWLESDAEGNLIVLTQNTEGVTEEDKRRLDATSEMSLGEMVNRIRRINVETSPDAPVVPRAFLATVEGSIYLFALIAPQRLDLLIRLQGELADRVQTPGGMPFNKYRAFRNQIRESDEPNRFVDGELVERFLDCPADAQKAVVDKLGVAGGVAEVKALVENLRRLH